VKDPDPESRDHDLDRLRWNHPVGYVVLACLFTIMCIYPLMCVNLSNGPGASVEWIIPNGFRGSVRIVEDPGGVTIPLVNGRYRVLIPADGYLVVKNKSFFYQGYEETAHFANGMSIPTLPDKDEGDQLAFFTDSSNNAFVGTWKQAHGKDGLNFEPGRSSPWIDSTPSPRKSADPTRRP
jgi:hypothetical protein